MTQIEFHLNQIEGGSRLKPADILIKPVPVFHALTLRQTGLTRAERTTAGQAIQAAVHQGRIQPAGAYGNIYYQRWALENGYTLGGVWRFVWHRGPMHGVDPAQYLTELQHPVDAA